MLLTTKILISGVYWKGPSTETTLGSFKLAWSATYGFLILRGLTSPWKSDCPTKCLHKKIFTLLSRSLNSTENACTRRRPTTTVYTNSWLVEQYKHVYCDWSLALHFKIVSEMISLNNALAHRSSVTDCLNDRNLAGQMIERGIFLMRALTSMNGRNMPHFSSALCGKLSSSDVSLCSTQRRWEM